MKSSLSRLRKIALNPKTNSKGKKNLQAVSDFDELAQAAKDMQEMRNCYDSLLSAAAATVNSAYEFSESLREMGECLLDHTPLNDDIESDRVLGMLGRVQFEIQKLVDIYRSHVLVTITKPSESLLNELQTVEEMKRQCDEKRDVYKYLITRQKEKGKSKNRKGENFSSQELRAAYDEYKEEANLCVFRLKSLKQGQSRSLLTQAARHHTAQLNFFRKGLKSLETVDPHVRHVSAQQYIDYLLSGPEEDDGEDGDDDENNNKSNEVGELSFSYKSNEGGDISSSESSVESNLDIYQGDPKFSSKEPKMGSYSEPLIAEKKFDLAEKVKQLKISAARKSNSYVLPTPTDAKETCFSRTSISTPQKSGTPNYRNLWHSSPFEENKNEKASLDDLVAESTNLKAWSNATSMQLPLPSEDVLSLPQIDSSNVCDYKFMKRQAFSGPLASKPWQLKNAQSTSGSTDSTDLQQQVSGALSQLSLRRSASPKVSPCPSPPLISSPKISELHELPRPPGDPSAKSANLSFHIGHSAPLTSRNQELSGASKSLSLASSAGSPLPTPPLVTRSFSIPSSSQRAMAIHTANLLDAPKIPDKVEEVPSPPLTPISLNHAKPLSRISQLASQSSGIQGGS